MPEDASQSHDDDARRYRSHTAKNMADAVSFLIQIALQAGMQNVAIGLAGVRNELLSISAKLQTPDVKNGGDSNHHQNDQLNRPH